MDIHEDPSTQDYKTILRDKAALVILKELIANGSSTQFAVNTAWRTASDFIEQRELIR